jgi:GT2 family glycosyltransferase
LTKSIGIIVPTLGKRPDYLEKCLRSIRAAGEAHICIVAPESFPKDSYLNTGLADQFVGDPGQGVSKAINAGVFALPEEVKYINWLGDDDLLEEDSLNYAAKALEENPQTVMVFGACNYIDPNGRVVWVNKSGQWASPLMHFGPDLIPQPGALYRRSAFEQVGGLSPKYNWAFDFDLFLNLKTTGKLLYINRTLASFRWHPESLSVEFRNISVQEASLVRVSHLPTPLRFISWLWEYPVRKATLIAGNRVTKRSNRLAA